MFSQVSVCHSVQELVPHVTITHDALGHGCPLPYPLKVPDMGPTPSGANQWRPVQTCSHEEPPPPTSTGSPGNSRVGKRAVRILLECCLMKLVEISNVKSQIESISLVQVGN